MLIRKYIPTLFLLTMVTLAFCKHEGISTVQEATSIKAPSGMAKIESRSGSKVQGVIILTQNNQDQVLLQIDLTGFAPNSTHAFHIHANGDCSDPKAVSAGPHFNPTASHHGGPDAQNRHAGDMGNLKANEKGEVHTQRINTMVTLDGDLPNSAIGKAIIIHESEDDFKTQPTGNAGGRIACGVITKGIDH